MVMVSGIIIQDSSDSKSIVRVIDLCGMADPGDGHYSALE